MKPSPEFALGLDVGGSRLKLLALTARGETLDQVVASSDSIDWRERCVDAVARLSALYGPPLVIGVAAPGLAARDERSIAFMPGRLPGIEGLDWTELLKSPRSVPVLNDAHAALLGEHWCGAARGVADVVMLTLGTGVGGAVLADGRLLRGRLGRAGHLGHITIDAGGPPDLVGTPGSLEDAIGSHTLAGRSDGRFTDTAALVAALGTGDVVAERVWANAIRALALALVSLINAFDPQRVVIGGGIARAGTALFTPLARELDHLEWRPGGARVEVVPATLGDLAGAYGAAYGALSRHDLLP